MDKDKNRSFRAQKLMEKIKKELKVEIDRLPEVFTRDEMYERIGELAALSFIKGDEGLRCISHTLTEDAFAGVPEEVRLKEKDTTYRIDNVFIDYYLDPKNNFVKNFVEIFSNITYAIAMVTADVLQSMMLPEEEKKRYLESRISVEETCSAVLQKK